MKESTKFTLSSAFALFSIFVALLTHFMLHGWVGTIIGIIGALINIAAITFLPHVPSSGSIKSRVFLIMGVPATATAALFGFLTYGLGGGLLYMLFTFVLYLVSFALRG